MPTNKIKITKPVEEQIGDYKRQYSWNKWRWFDSNNLEIKKEVAVHGWILNPDGTKTRKIARKIKQTPSNKLKSNQSTNSLTNPAVVWNDKTKSWPWNTLSEELDSIKVTGNDSSGKNGAYSLKEQQGKKEGQSTKLNKKTTQKSTKAAAPRNAGNSTNTQEPFVNDLPSYDLNRRGRIGNLNWNIGRQLVINNPEYNAENGFMAELGFKDKDKENSSVADIQRALQNYANNNYIQIRGLNSPNFVDNRWGTQTLSAWDLLYNHFKNTKAATPPTIPSTPSTNLGYRTENTYEDADTFRKYLDSLRLNSNEALRNWMNSRNTDYDWDADTYGKQFWSDVNKITGGDYSDKNLRNAFNTQGRWGSDFLGNGDYSDFQNALQRYTGSWNGIYDANLASRTGKDGIVYSNSHVRDLFDRFNGNPENKYTFNIPTYRISLKRGGLISKDPIELFKTFHNRFK